MGYQESFVKMRDSKDFDKLVYAIRKAGFERFDMAIPVYIITIKKEINEKRFINGKLHKYKFIKGERFLYVVGERHAQRNGHNFFGSCVYKPLKLLGEIEFYFAEGFSMDKVFNKGYAKVETFQWN